MDAYKTDLLDLRRMDCMDLMRDTPDKHYALAIVDPPYRSMSENQPTKDMRNNGSMSNFGDKPDAGYFEQLRRVSRNQIIWGANNFQLPPFKGFVVWKKKTIGENFTMSMCEIASLTEELGTVAKLIELAPQDPNRIHPTQKPIALYRWLLASYAHKGDNILDTHMGSGSIAIACHYAGYHLTATELDQDYFDAAVERIKRETSQKELPLFEQPTAGEGETMV